jgi:chromosome partitioning protein
MVLGAYEQLSRVAREKHGLAVKPGISPLEAEMKVIAIASLKDGCGKTSTAFFLAEALTHSGKHVVLMDADPNNNATDYLARQELPEVIEARSLHHALAGRRALEDCLIPSSFGLDLIPATPNLANAHIELAQDPGVALRFPMDIKGLDADVVLIDTPPALTIELTLALYASDIVIVPVGLSRWTTQGYQIIASRVGIVNRTTGRDTALLALPSIVTEREAGVLRAIPMWTTTRTAILKAPAIRNAANAGKRLKESAAAWEWYHELAEELCP